MAAKLGIYFAAITIFSLYAGVVALLLFSSFKGKITILSQRS